MENFNGRNHLEGLDINERIPSKLIKVIIDRAQYRIFVKTGMKFMVTGQDLYLPAAYLAVLSRKVQNCGAS
jgi:hypothetical protein